MVTQTEEVNTSHPETTDRSSLWNLLIVLVVWLGIIWLGHVRYAPSAPLGADAPPEEFSAARADVILKELVGDGIPHPAGSEHIKVVRQRIVALLEGWGYQVDQHATENKPRWDNSEPIPLVNLACRLTGKNSSNVVMLVAHYDSRTGPGASDDGVGMSAVLEIARMMKSRPQPENDVIFLITDGEEMGLLGAEKWVEEHPWAKEVDLAINVEARGTTGPSLMFETSENSQWLIEIFSKAVKQPMATSLFYEIYKFLPNDTDFTVFKKAGMNGYNFAFIGDVKNYHTLEDNYENADRGSMQHHGQNSWALIQALMDEDFSETPTGNAVYFDVFGWFMIWWPAHYSIYLCVASASLLVLTLVVRSRQASIRLTGIFVGLALSVLTLAVAGLLVYGANLAFALDERFENSWLPSPVPVSVAIWLAAGAGVIFAVGWLASGEEEKAECTWFGCLTLWLTLAVLTSVYLSGISYVFIVPCLLATTLGLFSALLMPRPFRLNCVMLPIAVAILWLPMERLFYDAVGYGLDIAHAVRIGIVMTSLLPTIASTRRSIQIRTALAFAGGTLIAVVAAVVLNPI